MFESVNIKNLNIQTFMMFHINDTTSFADIFTSKFSLEFKKFSKVKSDALTKAQTKKKISKEKKKISRKQ